MTEGVTMPDARWSVDLAVLDGPQVRSEGTLTVDGYDRITVTVPAAGDSGDGKVTVAVQPGDAGAVRLLAVNASSYRVADTVPLAYKVDGKPASGIALDAPLFLVGPGALSLLPGPAKQLELTNSARTAVVVDIVVGRTAAT